MENYKKITILLISFPLFVSLSPLPSINERCFQELAYISSLPFEDKFLKSFHIQQIIEHYNPRMDFLRSMEISKFVYDISLDEEIPIEILCAVITLESRWRERAKGGKGEIGFMQLMPSTAVGCAIGVGIEDYNSKMLYCAKTNMIIGAHFLSYLLKKYDDPVIALTCYNHGETRMKKWRERGYIPRYNVNLYYGKLVEVQKYLKRVVGIDLNWDKYFHDIKSNYNI